jgi:hypothetical protein
MLQKSAYRRRGTDDAFFEAIHRHPLDCAGDLRSTLFEECRAAIKAAGSSFPGKSSLSIT